MWDTFQLLMMMSIMTISFAESRFCIQKIFPTNHPQLALIVIENQTNKKFKKQKKRLYCQCKKNLSPARNTNVYLIFVSRFGCNIAICSLYIYRDRCNMQLCLTWTRYKYAYKYTTHITMVWELHNISSFIRLVSVVACHIVKPFL